MLSPAEVVTVRPYVSAMPWDGSPSVGGGKAALVLVWGGDWAKAGGRVLILSFGVVGVGFHGAPHAERVVLELTVGTFGCESFLLIHSLQSLESSCSAQKPYFTLQSHCHILCLHRWHLPQNAGFPINLSTLHGRISWYVELF